MDQLELVVGSVERFRMAQEEISVGLQVIVEVLDHLAFGVEIEVDQDVGAEDHVHILHERHAGRIQQVEAGEGD